jgi:hypothetical protein
VDKRPSSTSASQSVSPGRAYRRRRLDACPVTTGPYTSQLTNRRTNQLQPTTVRTIPAQTRVIATRPIPLLNSAVERKLEGMPSEALRLLVGPVTGEATADAHRRQRKGVASWATERAGADTAASYAGL